MMRSPSCPRHSLFPGRHDVCTCTSPPQQHRATDAREMGYPVRVCNVCGAYWPCGTETARRADEQS